MSEIRSITRGKEEISIAKTTYLFEAILQPNASLDQKGFRVLMLVIALVTSVAGIMFLMVGAWPVLAFFALDAALIYLAFKANYRWARMYETIRLTPGSLLIERISPLGRVQRWSFEPYWLKITIDLAAKHNTQLVLASRGKRLKIGSFLAPSEREEVARALQDQLTKLRQPDHLRQVN